MIHLRTLHRGRFGGFASQAQVLSQTLAAQTIGAAATAQLKSFFRTLAAQSIETPVIIRLVQLTVAAKTLGTATISRLGIYFRTLAAQSVLTAALSTVSSVIGQLFTQTISAVHRTFIHYLVDINLSGFLNAKVQGTAAINRFIAKSIAAAAIAAAAVIRGYAVTLAVIVYTKSKFLFNGLAGILRLRATMRPAAGIDLLVGKNILATAIETAAVSKMLAFGRTLAATVVGIAALHKGLARSLAAAVVEIPAILRQVGKQLRAEVVELPAIQRVMGLIIAAGTILRAAMTRASNVVQLYLQSITAVTIGAAAMTRGLNKTLAASAVLRAAISTAASVAQIFMQALAAATLATAVVIRSTGKALRAEAILQGSVIRLTSRLLAAGTITAANISRLTGHLINASTIAFAAITRLSGKILAANTVAVVNMSRLMSLFRTLAAVCVNIPGVQPASSTAVLIFQALSAALSGVPSISTNFITDAIVGIHLAHQRVTQFMKRFGLRRQTSTTRARVTNTKSTGPTVGSRGRGTKDPDDAD